MTAIEFTDWTQQYFAKVTDSIATDIEEVVKRAPSSALVAIKNWLRANMSPGQFVGVNSVYQAARETGSSLTTSDRRGFDVTCPACSAKWNYFQGVRDVCPHCGFPQIQEQNRRMAKSFEHSWPRYDEELKRAKKRLKSKNQPKTGVSDHGPMEKSPSDERQGVSF